MQSEYPILHFDLKLKTDKHWKVEFLVGNGSPKLNYSQEDEGHVFTLQANDLNGIQKHPWHYVFRSNPFYKLYVKYSEDFIERRFDEGERHIFLKLRKVPLLMNINVITNQTHKLKINIISLKTI